MTKLLSAFILGNDGGGATHYIDSKGYIHSVNEDKKGNFAILSIGAPKYNKDGLLKNKFILILENILSNIEIITKEVKEGTKTKKYERWLMRFGDDNKSAKNVYEFLASGSSLKVEFGYLNVPDKNMTFVSSSHNEISEFVSASLALSYSQSGVYFEHSNSHLAGETSTPFRI
jgi:hypothetical protein